MMRIIAGKYKGRKIGFPAHIRPTQDKVRQSVFDCLAGVSQEARVLDLFAGSGAYGLESLSRGAQLVYFLDDDRKCTLSILKNLEKLGLAKEEGVTCFNYTNDAFRALGILEKRGVIFDLVFVDPPYHKGLAKKALQTLAGGGILAPLGFVAVEHSKAEALPEGEGVLKLVKQLKHSATLISIYQRE